MLGLLTNQTFWTGLVAVAQTVVFSLIPDFPMEVWLAIDGLAVALIASQLIEGDIRGLASRRVLIAALALAQSLVLGVAGVSPAVWGAVDAIAVVLINAFAIVDRINPDSRRNTAG